jgi:hypothetical protein
MSYGTLTVASAPGFGRHPPEKVPSSVQDPVKVASTTVRDRDGHAVAVHVPSVGKRVGEKLEYTVEEKASVPGS